MNRPERAWEPEAELFPWEWAWFFLLLIVAMTVLALFPDDAWACWLSHWRPFAACTRRYVAILNETSPLVWTFLPSVFIVGIGGALVLVFDRPSNWMRFLVGAVFFAMQVAYLTFRLVATLSLDTFANATCSIAFFLSECFVHARIMVGNFSMLRLTDRSAEADESERAVHSGEYVPEVDVFVPTYSESAWLLRRTIVGCQAIDYPKKTVWLLDDMRRPEMRALAAELGCNYLDRPDNRGAKAGNLNHARGRSRGEFIVVFDADFIPTRDFISRTVGFFRDPQVAMVQTPQNFYNDDAVTRNLGLEGVLEDEQRLFFRALQPGRDAANAIVCHGSCFIVRRSALEEIGGIPTETITEDWATSIKMQAAGYKLYYLNEALSGGMSADTSGEFIEQRSRWAQGTLQALFASTHPLHTPGLTWRQRVLHMSSIFYYLGSVSNLLNLVLPLFFLFGGVTIMRMTVPEMIFYRIPFTLGYYLLYSWLTLGMRSAIWSEVYDALLAPTMALTVVRTLVHPFGAGFRVTNKSKHLEKISVNWSAAIPFIVLLALHVAGIAYAVDTNRHVEDPDMFRIVCYFALINMALIWMCFLICIDVPHAKGPRRFPLSLDFTLEWETGQANGKTTTLSETEAGISRALFGAEIPQFATLDIPSLGFARMVVRIPADPRDGLMRLAFPELSQPEYRALIAMLYCRPRQWDTPRKSELRAIWEYYRAGFRMYPLAESGH